MVVFYLGLELVHWEELDRKGIGWAASKGGARHWGGRERAQRGSSSGVQGAVAELRWSTASRPIEPPHRSSSLATPVLGHPDAESLPCSLPGKFPLLVELLPAHKH